VQASKPRVVYTPRPDATPKGEISALAAVYRFILFESPASKEGSPATAPDNAKVRSKNDSRATEPYTRSP
jgi:hypothetical protein